MCHLRDAEAKQYQWDHDRCMNVGLFLSDEPLLAYDQHSCSNTNCKHDISKGCFQVMVRSVHPCSGQVSLCRAI